MPTLVSNTYQEVNRDVQGIGLLATLAILLHAYSLGGGTYTGIEAVSNGLQILREPRVITGKKTMLYMATSLAFTAGGILLCYLLNRVRHEPGKTLNASLFAKIYGGFFGADTTTTASLVIVTLITEAALLIVAAQAGFLDGPRVLSNMSLDSWAPHRLSHLSDQLVTRNGVWFMGIARSGFFGLHPRRSEAVGSHVQHQRVSDLHLVAVGHVPALVAGAPERRSLGARNWRSTASGCYQPARFFASRW